MRRLLFPVALVILTAACAGGSGGSETLPACGPAASVPVTSISFAPDDVQMTACCGAQPTPMPPVDPNGLYVTARQSGGGPILDLHFTPAGYPVEPGLHCLQSGAVLGNYSFGASSAPLKWMLIDVAEPHEDMEVRFRIRRAWFEDATGWHRMDDLPVFAQVVPPAA